MTASTAHVIRSSKDISDSRQVSGNPSLKGTSGPATPSPRCSRSAYNTACSFTFAWLIEGDYFQSWSRSVRRFPDAAAAACASVQWKADLARHGIQAEVDVVEVTR